MKRRDFIASAALAAALPLSARAQNMPLVAFLGVESEHGYERQIEAFRAGLRDAGYLEAKNIAVEYRWAEGRYDRLQQLADELVRLKPAVIVTHGSPGTTAAKKATGTIPIVIAAAGDAVAMGFVKDLARPEGNITGSTFIILEVGPKRLQLLKEAVPGASRVGYFFNPDNPITAPTLETIEKGAKSLKITLDSYAIRTLAELEAAIRAAATKKVSAVLIGEYSMFVANGRRIAELALQLKVPAVGYGEFADAGGLIGYGIDTPAMFRRAAFFVDKILRGAQPRDLPVERASRFEVVVNRNTARKLGITLPQSVMVRADRVIE